MHEEGLKPVSVPAAAQLAVGALPKLGPSSCSEPGADSGVRETQGHPGENMNLLQDCLRPNEEGRQSATTGETTERPVFHFHPANLRPGMLA